MNDYISVLTTAPLPADARRRALDQFAMDLGWQPSDPLDLVAADEVSNAHLVVEHGLQNTAMISFLRRSYADLSAHHQRQLISLSYNNLVDWHVAIDPQRVHYVFNRIDPPEVIAAYPVQDEAALRSDVFAEVIGKKPSPNIPALDDALIKTISLWKRHIFAELGGDVDNYGLSMMFNAVIFYRAVEDYYNRTHSGANGRDSFEDLFAVEGSTLAGVLIEGLTQYGIAEEVAKLIDFEVLRQFDVVERGTFTALVGDFYRNRYARGLVYDFAVMSKHALSRIYERYVSVLRTVETQQQSLFGELPEETLDRLTGNVYTPEFIARFFAKYLREELPPKRFRALRSIDHACGSGLFLRTLLEFQCEGANGGLTREEVGSLFGGIKGIDIDPNACLAARLSLALLHLVVTGGALPAYLDIQTDDALRVVNSNEDEVEAAFDVVVTNPPFIAIERQTRLFKERAAELLGDRSKGRVDAYLAFVAAGIRMLKPGGYGLFVVPHSFLIAESAALLRSMVVEECWVRLIADLSGIKVFEDVGAYVVLLIFQKRTETELVPEDPVVVRAHELLGDALLAALRGQERENSYYSVGRLPRERLDKGPWIIRSPSQMATERRVSRLPVLSEFLDVAEGYVSGADEVFIVPEAQVPSDGHDLFRPLVADREMVAFRRPTRSGLYCFYPYVDGELLNEEELRSGFPRTWEYLGRHRKLLGSRRQVAKGNLAWWKPERPRPPKRMLRPKLLTPHLVIVPKFSLDSEGVFIVSRSPVAFLKDDEFPDHGAEVELLRFFLGVLNSTAAFGLLSAEAHRYGNGYLMLEPKSLRRLRVPDPRSIDPTLRVKLVALVAEREALGRRSAFDLERRIDQLVGTLYGASDGDLPLVSMRSRDGGIVRSP